MARVKPTGPKPLGLEDQLRQAISGCGLSLNQLAKATGVHQAQLSRFMRAERTLTLTVAARLCAYLGLDLAGPALDKKA
jgi:plasmid maintenance system antidote protein VapI